MISSADDWKDAIFNLEPKGDASWINEWVTLIDNNSMSMEIVGVTPPPTLVMVNAYAGFLSAVTFNASPPYFKPFADGFNATAGAALFTPSGQHIVNGVPVIVASITAEPSSVAAGLATILGTSDQPTAEKDDIDLGNTLQAAYAGLKFIVTGTTPPPANAPFTAVVGVQ